MSEEVHTHEHHNHEHTEQAPVERIDNSSLPDVKLTPTAIEMVRKMQVKEGLGAEHGLRIGVTGGGCSGFQYSLNFDTLKEGDRVTDFGGVLVYVDDISLPYIAGTTLDYVEGLHGAGFRFDNPRASRTCGCGSSFSA
jgi:iron-sulfur cluster assembly accessory protein